jgi:hypothetical protein
VDLRETGDLPRHPWEIARMRFFRAVLRRETAGTPLRLVLDGGAGDAWFARQLLDDLPLEAQIRCWDTGYTDETESAMRAWLPERIRLVREQPAMPHDLVTLLDVLEHVEDDRGFLDAVVRESLHPDGFLLMSVPAWQGLYTRHDTFLQHHRRYAPAQAKALLHDAGLDVVQHGGLFHSLLAPRALGKLHELLVELPQGQHQPGIAWRGGKALTAAVLGALQADNAASHWLAQRGIELPGLSWWALCRRRAAA